MARLAAWANEYCTLRSPSWFYDSDGALVTALTDQGEERSIRDPQGWVLWRSRKVRDDRFTDAQGTEFTFYVQSPDGQRLGEVSRIVWESYSWWPDEVEVRYQHRETPVVTDENGRWVNDPDAP